MSFSPNKLPAVRRRLGDESGLGIVEVLVAAIILVTGMLATFQMFDAASRNKLRSEQRQVGLDRAQREMEKLRNVPYDELALTSTPLGSSNQDDPRYRVSGTDFALNKDGSGDATMVVNGGARYGGGTISGGEVNPGPEHFTSGDISGDIFRFVVWRDDLNCTSVCPGTQDLKRVVVAVLIDAKAQTGQRPYMETQSDFIDPEDSSITDLPPGPTGTVTAQQFFLADTPCESDGSTARVAPSADHALHNTLGLCSDGPQTGTTAGAPDVLLTSAPGGTPGDPTYDYANDAILEPDPNTDRGVQLLRQDDDGCDYTPGGSDQRAKIHRWVTDPFPSNFTLAGDATLEFHTKTVNEAQMAGKICIYLFTRNVGVDTQLVNSANGNPYWTYEESPYWPTDPSTPRRRNMVFTAGTVVTGQRLGVAISLDRSVETTDGFEFLFDHVDYQSRLEVSTTTPLGG